METLNHPKWPLHVFLLKNNKFKWKFVTWRSWGESDPRSTLGFLTVYFPFSQSVSVRNALAGASRAAASLFQTRQRCGCCGGQTTHCVNILPRGPSRARLDWLDSYVTQPKICCHWPRWKRTSARRRRVRRPTRWGNSRRRTTTPCRCTAKRGGAWAWLVADVFLEVCWTLQWEQNMCKEQKQIPSKLPSESVVLFWVP